MSRHRYILLSTDAVDGGAVTECMANQGISCMDVTRVREL